MKLRTRALTWAGILAASYYFVHGLGGILYQPLWDQPERSYFLWLFQNAMMVGLFLLVCWIGLLSARRWAWVILTVLSVMTALACFWECAINYYELWDLSPLGYLPLQLRGRILWFLPVFPDNPTPLFENIVVWSVILSLCALVLLTDRPAHWTPRGTAQRSK